MPETLPGYARERSEEAARLTEYQLALAQQLVEHHFPPLDDAEKARLVAAFLTTIATNFTALAREKAAGTAVI